MPISSRIIFIFIIAFLGVSIKAVVDQCEDTKYIISKCYTPEKYQWLIEVPKTKNSCGRDPVAQPKSVGCDFACAKGKTFDRDSLKCKQCPTGTFSLGGGSQYTFSDAQQLNVTMPELSLKSTALSDYFSGECKKKGLWQVKGNILQGDVQPNCAISLVFRFKLERAGLVTITYNLATSYVFGEITSRCGFSITDNDNSYDDDDDDAELRKRVEVTLLPTGYGVWKDKKISIDSAGDYVLSLSTYGFSAFHFPFAIRSIIIEGHSSVQDCISCPPGTIAAESGSDSCTTCPINTYASDEGSTECSSCNKDEYADEGSSKCTKKPVCEAKHYQKVFTGCDKSDMATITYEPIQPKICTGGVPPATTQLPCGTCNPGMYKSKDTGKCEFCPSSTYSDGTLIECLKCDGDLSVLPGLYYKNWNELPTYLKRSYISFDDTKDFKGVVHSQSWVPSLDYISSQAYPDALSVLSITIAQGFRATEVANATKEYGTIFFKFSILCKTSCRLFFVSQEIDGDDNDDWDVINKWNRNQTSQHTDKLEYSYSIQYPNEIIFNWLFESDDDDPSAAEIRIYEIRVTNTKLGGSDRCIKCLTANNEATKCISCPPGRISSNNTCIHCSPSTVASRVRPNDPVPTVCKPCTNNTISYDGVTCHVPCKQTFNGPVEYNLQEISTIEFHGSKLFTQKGSGYFHVFNASVCGNTSVTCAKTSTPSESKRSSNQMIMNSKLCRMGIVPGKTDNETSVAYTDDFGEQLVNASLWTSKYFPPLRSDYNLTDLTLVYRANTSSSQSSCSERITFLSLRCDHTLDDEKQNSSVKYKLQTPNDCASGTCDGCTFYFLVRTPFACPTCDIKTYGFRTFVGPCKFGRQEVRKVPYAYCSHNLTETVENNRCSVFSIEIQIIIGLFVVIAATLISVVIVCWRKNRKLEYRYMQLVENANPDDDTPVDNVCAQISDEEDSSDEVQFKTQSKAKKIMNAVRKVIRKNPHGQSDSFNRDSFLLASTSTNDA